MTTLLLEPFGGLAGDMLLAALLDLDDPRFTLADLRGLADALVPGEAVVELEEVRRGGLRARYLRVRSPESADPPHRHLADLLALVATAPLSEGARARARAVLARLAEAEARVHGVAVEAVHFHEVGAVDTLVDVCGAALALERLGVTRVLGTPPLAGSGTVRCAHGEMPVPTPAVCELMRGRPLALGGAGERLTPTGAALWAELVEGAPAGLELAAARVGYGAGARDPREGPPNLVRVVLAAETPQERAADEPRRDVEAWQLEANLDDTTGEDLGFCVRGLREAGALDVWTAPIQMKKDRPGVVLAALCRADARAALERVVFERTGTLGVRWSAVRRTECARAELVVRVRDQAVRVKVRGRPGAAATGTGASGSAGTGASGSAGTGAAGTPGVADLSPEQDDLERLAQEHGLSPAEARFEVLRAALDQLSKSPS